MQIEGKEERKAIRTKSEAGRAGSFEAGTETIAKVARRHGQSRELEAHDDRRSRSTAGKASALTPVRLPSAVPDSRIRIQVSDSTTWPSQPRATQLSVDHERFTIRAHLAVQNISS